MPTYRIDTMSVKLSQMVQDDVAAYNTDGTLFTSVQRLAAINAARQKIYSKLYEQMGPEEFALAFPEFCLETDTSNVVTDGIADRIANARYFLAMKLTVSTSNYPCRRIPNSLFYEMQYNPDSVPAPTAADDIGYCEHNNKLYFFGATGGTAALDGTYTAVYLKDIVTGAYQADIADPAFWEQETLELAAEILIQSNVKNKQ